MVTRENEYYLQSVLLLSDGGSYITKKIIRRELPKHGNNLDILLLSNAKKIEKEFKKNGKQIDKLFPANGHTDLKNWDIPMLAGTILILFKWDLEYEERRQIREIIFVRHELAHSPSAALLEDDYKDVNERLVKALTTLSSRFSTCVQEHCKELITKCASCPLDVTSSIERLKEMKHTDELFEKILEEIEQLEEKLSGNIEEVKSKICQTISETSQATANRIGVAETGLRTAMADAEQSLSSQMETVQIDLKSGVAENHKLLLAVIEELSRKRQIQPFERIRSIVNSKLTFSGEEEVVNLADKIILKVIIAAIKRTEGSTEMERIRRAVDDILDELDKIEGVKVLCAEPQCIVVRIQCDSYKSLHEALMFITSQSYQTQLSIIAEALNSHLLKPLTLHSSIPSECLQSILDEMATTESSKRRSILLPIQCDTIEGLENVIKLFESDVLSEKLDKLSVALSEKLKGKVSVDAEVDKIYTNEDTEHTSTGGESVLPLEEGESLIDKSCYVEKKRLSEDHSYWEENQSTWKEHKTLITTQTKAKASTKDTRSQDTKLVVAAIDIGTSFTAYAYSYVNEYQRDHLQAFLKTKDKAKELYIEIYTYDEWKNVLGISTSKTPTVVLFDESGEFHSLGYEAEIKYAELMEEDSDAHYGWKYFSDLSQTQQRNATFMLTDDQNNPMPALDVYAAILKYLKDHLLNHLSYRIADLHEADIHWVLTVPTSLSDKELQMMAGAAEKACLSNDRLTFASKPEVAAIYCKELLASKASEFRKREEKKYFSPCAQFVVLDAGGRTVNLSAHEVQTDGTMTEILHSDVLSPNDGSWGGCLVDSKLKAFLESLFGSDVMEEFQRECKIDVIELQHSIEMMKRQCKDPENEKEDYKICLKVPAILLNTFKRKNNCTFHKHVAESSHAMSVQARRNKVYLSNDFVIELYRESKEKLTNHLREIFRNNPVLENVKTIIMIGGFGHSEILKNEIRWSFPRKHVVIPEDAGVAIVKGAVMFGFNTKMYS